MSLKQPIYVYNNHTRVNRSKKCGKAILIVIERIKYFQLSMNCKILYLAGLHNLSNDYVSLLQTLHTKLIILLVLPTKVELIKPNEPLSVSKSVVLICKSFGSRPPATITWWKKGKFMGKAPEEVSCRDIFGYLSLF